MRSAAVLILGFGALTAQCAWAQPKIAPSREYSSTPPTSLDKNFGLPSFGIPGAELPRQKTQTPKPEPKTDPEFFANTPPSGASETPDFFAAAPDEPGTPDFFGGKSDLTVPKTPTAAAGTAAPETPMYTTEEGYSTKTPPADRLETDDTPRGDAADQP